MLEIAVSPEDFERELNEHIDRCMALARKEERAVVVAWLREEAKILTKFPARVVLNRALAVERGDHLQALHLQKEEK